MPNWCSTSIAVFGNKDNIRELYSKLEEIKKENRVENGFSNLWEGNLLDIYGIDWKSVHCRGEIEDYYMQKTYEGKEYLRISQNDAWSPNTDYLYEIFKKAGYDVDLVYLAEEPGCLLFENADSTGLFFKEEYKIDWLVEEPIEELGLKEGDEMYEYFDSEEDLLKALKEKGLDFKTFEEAEEEIEKYRDSFDWLCMYKFDFV